MLERWLIDVLGTNIATGLLIIISFTSIILLGVGVVIFIVWLATRGAYPYKKENK